MQGRRIRVRGQVQGVGFRPFIWQLAHRMGLCGDVLNDPEGVLIRVVGANLDGFETAIRAEAPMLARVDAVESTMLDFDPPEGFEIVPSRGQGAETRVTPDAATCPDCLAEIRDSQDRRFGYAFANCTHCGPRFTILKALPYDRARTSMAVFPMCPDCAAEYDDPGDRRFHAQPAACVACGPRLWLESGGEEFSGDPIAEAARRLACAEVLAIKGLGGFHLCVDARQPQAVALLRQRKRRPDKPLALMADEAAISRHAEVSTEEWKLLRDAAAPIVLLRKKGAALPEALAPGLDVLGWMLPYTPLHHLLVDAVGGPLVMTSGNLSGEPQVIGNQEARDKLSAFADAFVMHDRDIARRLDDSVERMTRQGPMVLRRARGRVPGTLPLPDGFQDAPQGVAFGGQMKAAICLLKNGQALLGHHLGELDDAVTWEAFQQADRDYADLFDHRPEWVACDLHPDFRASRHAEATGLPLIRVQHHHAHLAACLGENGWPLEGGKVAGILLDGLGLGPDGTVWGAEVLLGNYRGFERRASLTPAPLIGGDRAQMEPWRNALVRLDQAGLSEWADELFPQAPRDLARQAARAGINAPLSSSAGRLFDAVAACLGICPIGQSFEGQAAMRLEALARQAPETSAEFTFDTHGGVIDPVSMWQQLRRLQVAGVGIAPIAWQFHAALADAFAREARDLVEAGDAQAVALSGGCFQNALLLDLTIAALNDLPVLIHRKTPANDGGLALGQALIAAAHRLG
ncbi:Hydrogenase maturation protein, carbamoyltransferase HypF [Thalassovita gelatinovora]|uniref:carbamoyltransferase HypF n=1 Tax=Thalassovita gelatinovora TaxID=53501 RepID=UPI00071D7DA3|nr:carbamoyltransferase HypF [Thalassovita gelatinovora]QIZ82388.1 carbamoyltransferase HypF [Thalassovita gelatinovora]SEQ52821.1 Hydrogenase maturation protein, carbamoyltransferase HypF [Thalassovita gelatinovora]